ncbi:hypothetical protein [Chitinimonas lacunae]|uniref:General secretion pathway protein GspK n=1 Tax=Chitinimonas lacunae TaxID=1963018 RepID=A0ABV8MWW5_9NEIS
MKTSLRRQRGYILLYVLGTLLVLGMLALSVAYKQRVGFQLFANNKERMQSELLIRNAAEYTLAQIAMSVAIEPLVQVKDPAVSKIERWSEGHTGTLDLDGQQVEIDLAIRPFPPDINQLDDAQLTRLFVSLGADAKEAEVFAKLIVGNRPPSGYPNFDAIRGIAAIPRQLIDGGIGEEDGRPKGLVDYLSIGTNSRKVDPVTTDLLLVAALTGWDESKLDKLRALRRAGEANAQTIKEIGPEIQPFLGAGDMYRATLRAVEDGRWAEATFISDRGKWKIRSFKLHDKTTPISEVDTEEEEAAKP